MKKLLITLIMTFVVVFSFALIASAAEYKSVKDYTTNVEFSTDFGETTIIQGMSEKSLFDTTSRVVLKNKDGSYTTYPTYYILQNKNSVGGGNEALVFEELNSQTGEEYDYTSIILIELPEGVKTLQQRVFGRDSDNTNATDLAINAELVVLPDSLTTLNEQAFRRSVKLKCVVLSKNITDLASWRFAASASLEEIIIPEGSQLQTMGNGFRDCAKLKYINLENATMLEKIGDNAFFNCTSLPYVDFSKLVSLKTIGNEAFRGCTLLMQNMTSLEFPEGFESVGNYAFYGYSALEIIVFPSSFKSIGDNTFQNCTSLQNVVVSAGLESIGTSAFRECTLLQNIDFSKSTKLESIGSSAFENCKTITRLDFSKCKLTSIGNSAFKGMSSVVYMVFPESLTKLSEYAIDGDLGSTAIIIFLGKMTEVNLGSVSKNTQLSVYFAKNSSTDVTGRFVESRVYKDGSNNVLTYIGITGKSGTGEGSYTYREGSLTLKYGESNINSGSKHTTTEEGDLYRVNTNQTTFYFCGDEKIAFAVRTSFFAGDWTSEVGRQGNLAVFDMGDYRDAARNVDVSLTTHITSDECTTTIDATCTERGKISYYCYACGKVLSTQEFGEALGHDLEHGTLKGIMYPNGFDKSGYKQIECARCFETDETTVALAIFAARGYSISLEGDAIIGGYKILVYEELGDFIPLDEYEALYGSLTFGIIFVNVNNTNTITFDESGVIQNSNAIQVRVSTPADKDDDDETENELRKYNEFKCKVAGFDRTYDDLSKQPKAMQLVISMYVFDGENMTFIQSENAYDSKEVTANGVKLNVVTFNALYQKAGETDSMFGTPSEE